MKTGTFLERYSASHSTFRSELAALSEQSQRKFLKYLSREKQETNFLSRISEFKFAQFLEKEQIKYEYEPTIELGKTPDFRIALLGSSACYFDVKRFNIHELEQINNKRINQLASRLMTIPKPFYIRIEQLCDTLNFNLVNTFEKIETWLLNPARNLGDYCNIENQIAITITNLNGIKNHIGCTTRRKVPKINPNKLKSVVTEKLNTYYDAIISKGFPFFVAIDLTFETLLDPSEFLSKFKGGALEDLDSGKKSFHYGDFYNDKSLEALVGILILYNCKFYWIKNPKNQATIEFQTAISNFD